MKKTILLVTTILLLLLNVDAQVLFGSPEKINDQWKFVLQDEVAFKGKNYDDSKWRTINLPHDWSIEGTLSPSLASATGYLPGGIAWYRKHLEMPEVKNGEKTYIYFEGIYNRSEVYVNGNLVGKRPNGYISCIYDITPFIQQGGDNVIAVRVDHSRSADSRWYTGSGIYRNVYLIQANPVHIDTWGVTYQTPNISNKEATMNVQVAINNSTAPDSKLTVSLSVLTSDGKSVASATYPFNAKANETTSLNASLKIKNPVLWNLNNPYLYQLVTKVISNGKVIDQSMEKIGIRSATFDANKGFFLNGEHMKLKGVCIHHDAGCLGSAVPREVWERRLKNLKSLGCNAIRMSHNPQAPDVYALCDELGFLVMDEAFDEWEFAKRKWLKGWNAGTPGFEGSYDFFEEWSDRDIQDMVKRDRNHPSVIMWSIGNEVDYPNDPYSHAVLDGSSISQPMFGGYKPEQPAAERLGNIAKRLVAGVKKHDTSRPVTAALAGVVMSNETAYPGVLDIAGYNYTEDRYAIDHKKYPSRVIYGSENRSDLNAWKAVRENEYISGQFIWTGIDYLGESSAWPSRGLNTGLLDFGGFVKPRGYFRQALWATNPVIYIGTYKPIRGLDRISMDAWPVWNYEPNEKIRVVCFTNCQKATLLLNGKTVGETKNFDDNTGIIYWDIPYEPGKLEVIGLNNDQQACRYEIKTFSRPYMLTAETDKKQLNKNKGVAHVVVNVKDENGIPVMLSDDEITCEIKGPAKLLGLESGNNADMGNYRDNKQRAYHGRLLAYIQATGNTGTITLQFTAPWIKAATVTIETVE